VAVTPGDVAADHAGLGVVAVVVGAVEGEVAQGGELGFDAVEPAGVERDVGQLDVVGLDVLADSMVASAGEMGLKLSSTIPMRTWGG
jgi:hypothetical protein